MSVLHRILGLSPYVEVAVRRLYWGSDVLRSVIKRLPARRRTAPRTAQAASWQKISSFIGDNGVNPGSLLLVHSSAAALETTGKTPDQLLDALLALVGEAGTLAMPAFANYSKAMGGAELMTADVAGLVLEYDVRRSIPWTGLLPYKLMRRPGAIRSRHPLNSMVALGPLAVPMMADNLVGPKPLPCGTHSSWKFCADHGAVIVALGVDLAHSLTMIHVAEDSIEAAWPVDDWYRDRRFKIKDKDFNCEVTVRERHPRWARYYAERTLSKDLKSAGLIKAAIFDGISVEVLVARDLLGFLALRRDSAYPYFMVPNSSRKSVVLASD